MKSLRELTAEAAQTGGQEGHGSPRSGSPQRQAVQRFLTRKPKEEDLGALDPALAALPSELASITAGLKRQLARAKASVLQKKETPGKDGLGDDSTLSQMMAD